MGSRSSEQPLRRGDFLQAVAAILPARHPTEPTWTNPAAQAFRIIESLEGKAMIASDFWTEMRFRVGSRSNRLGLRLEGPPCEIPTQPDRLSAPVAPGTVQVAGGQIIVLGVACGTMGGYPHVADVVSADLDRVGQLSPGDQIQFQPVALASARKLDVAARFANRALLVRLASMARDC
jgi:antagonist of KipI